MIISSHDHLICIDIFRRLILSSLTRNYKYNIHILWRGTCSLEHPTMGRCVKQKLVRSVSTNTGPQFRQDWWHSALPHLWDIPQLLCTAGLHMGSLLLTPSPTSHLCLRPPREMKNCGYVTDVRGFKVNPPPVLKFISTSVIGDFSFYEVKHAYAHEAENVIGREEPFERLPINLSNIPFLPHMYSFLFGVKNLQHIANHIG